MMNSTRAMLCAGLTTLCLSTAMLFSGAATAAAAVPELDLAKAVVLVPKKVAGPEAQATRMLVEEIEKRTQIRWKVVDTEPRQATPLLVVGQNSFIESFLRDHGLANLDSPAPQGAEGYTIRILQDNPPAIIVSGNDTRGVLFGVGRLLRELRMSRRHIALPAGLKIATVPKYPLRGHQLGYRPKTNSYDAWSVPMWEQYIRDLAVFGTNAIELIPPRSDDAADSPHFPLPPMPMMVEMSRLANDYGLDVWIWYPAMDADYSNPKTVESALAEWAEVFKQLPRVDAVFVPGGDPGHTDPRVLLPFLEKQTANLRRFHPKAQMWVSPQSFNQEWLDAFNDYLKTKQPDWLAGVVYGPQVRCSLPELRAAVPARYPIRRYPDITHSIQCQYPVTNWDIAYAATESREVINPRPQEEAQIFRVLQNGTIGFLTYSEGCNDDVNKFVWSGLGWDPDMPVIDILRDYARYFLSDSVADDFAQGLMALERNWKGPLLTNGGVETTLQQFQALERTATPALTHNWRFQQALYRAYYDAYIHRRLQYETALEDQARNVLELAPKTSALTAVDEAEKILDRGVLHPPVPELRARVFELGDTLFQSVRMQLSVSRHKAIGVDRGATLDSLDTPLNNRLWLKRQFAEIRKLDGENQRLGAIRSLTHWTDPGPGGFYDDLGNLTRQPHLVRGEGFNKDPGCFNTARFGYAVGRLAQSAYPMSWWTTVEALYDSPLKMHYENLDRTAAYAVRISYAGDSPGTKIRLLADDKYVVHGEMSKPRPAAVVQFDIPTEATRDGQLTLTWYRQKGLGGNGRGNAIAEIWLIKKSP